MAGAAILRGAFEDTLFMAPLAFYLGMSAGELERSQAVIEAGALPAIRCMADLAILTEACLVSVVLGVAGEAVLRSALKHIVDVARLAIDLGMRAGERESSQAVVEICAFPPIRGMADLAVLTEATLVGIILGVAGEAVLRRALKHIVDVAPLAFDLGMRAGERESSQAVVEADTLPAIRSMAFLAILTKATLVGVVLSVTGEAILRCLSQVCWGARPGMAAGAGCRNMLSLQRKRQVVVVKALSIGVDPVVAGEATLPEGI